MANPDRKFTVIQGGTGPDSGAQDTFIDTGVVDGKGRPMLRRVDSAGHTGGGGDGDVPPLWKLDVKRDVQIAKWGLAGLLTLVGLFFWLVYLPDTKEVRGDIAGINTNVAVIAKSNGDIQVTLDRVESRLDQAYGNNPQAGAGAGQARGVSGAKGAGAKRTG
jgi:hypothetical protein